MNLREYLDTLDGDARKALAKAADTEVIYLIQIAGGHSSPSPKLAARLEIATEGKVTRYDLRPDIFDPPAKPARRVAVG